MISKKKNYVVIGEKEQSLFTLKNKKYLNINRPNRVVKTIY